MLKESKTDYFNFAVELKDNSQPKTFKPRKIAFEYTDEVESQIKQLLQRGVLERSTNSDWSSPITVVKKKNGKLRIRVDFRYLNTMIKSDPYPLPHIDTLLAKINPKATVYASVDLKDSFFSMSIPPDQRDLFTITTPFGSFRYTKTSFGIKTAPAAFQRAISWGLRDIVGISIYMDDILIGAENKTALEEKVKEVLNRLADLNLEVNFEKIILHANQITWLGFQFDKNGYRPCPNRLNTLKKIILRKIKKNFNHSSVLLIIGAGSLLLILQL